VRYNIAMDFLIQAIFIKMKLQKMNNRQYFVTLPNQIVRAKGWEKRDLIKVEINDRGKIVLKK
jgi:hypothetical protein